MDFIVSIGFIVVCIGVWRWAALRLGRKGSGWFVRHFMGSCAGFFAGLLVVAFASALGIISPEEKQLAQAVPHVVSGPAVHEELKGSDSAVEQAIMAEQVKTLGITPVQYAERLNQIFKRANINHRADAQDIAKGLVNDGLKMPIGQYTSLIMVISKDTGQISGITVIGAGDGTQASGLEILMVASAALAAAAPATDFKEVFRRMPDLFGGQEFISASVKLSVMQIDELGTWFFASPI